MLIADLTKNKSLGRRRLKNCAAQPYKTSAEKQHCTPPTRFSHAEKDGEVLREPDNPTKSCKARGSDLRVHFKMDWQGQKLAEQLMQIMLVSFAVVGFISGYVLGSFQIMLLIYAAGVLLTSLITVPNWPFFNRHPLKWLDPSEAEQHPKPVSANTSSKKNTSKK